MTDETAAASEGATTQEGATADGGGARVFAPLQIRDPGRYQVLAEHGRGGIGRVVRATDREFGRDVAVKELLRRTATSERRFFREALITARLEHPNIVPVHEAGRWPDGTPFYVMKLVAGRSLRDFIDEAKTYRDRLALVDRVLAVVDAIAYAHDRGVIHRDLKPSNIMVGDYGETIVIDWGLAKNLQDPDDAVSTDGEASPGTPELTAAGTVLGTPAYMAPEQGAGSVADARSDVYALGAILSEVLGRPKAGAAGEIPADLASIVSRAMAREAADRYQTAQELAEDLRRFRTGLLVSAHTYSARERLRKFIARYRAAVAVGAVALLTLLAVSLVLVSRIVAERDTAQTHRSAAEELISFMNAGLRDRLEAVGRLDALGDVGQRVEGYYQSVAKTSDLDTDQRRRRAEAQLLAGDVADATGNATDAEPYYQRGAALLEANAAAGDVRSMRVLARASLGLAAIAIQRTDLDAAEKLVARARELLDRAAARSPEDTAALLQRLEVVMKRGSVLSRRGRIDDVIAGAQEGIRLAERHPAATDDRIQAAIADLEITMTRVEQTRARWEEALPHGRNAIARLRPLIARSPKDARLNEILVDALSLTGSSESRTGRLDEAGPTLQEAADLSEKMGALEPDRTSWRMGQAGIARVLGGLEKNRGRIDDARRAFERAVAVGEGLVKARPEGLLYQRDLALSHSHLGQLERDAGRVDLALVHLRRSLELISVVVAKGPNDTRAVDQLGHVEWQLGKTLADRDPAEARRHYEQARDRFETIERSGKLSDDSKQRLAEIRKLLAP